MAITVGASTQNNGNTASVDLPIPAHAAGDLLLAWFESTGQAIGTTPTGWTLVGSTSTRGSLYTRFDTAGTLTGTASWGLTASNRWAGGITAFTGVDPAIWDLGAPTIVGATTASLTVPSITPTSAGTVLVTGFANSSPTVAATVPAGFTAQNTVSSSGYVVLATQPWPNAGTATGDVIWNQASSRACGAFLGALRPAATGGTTYQASSASAATTAVLGAVTAVLLAGGIAAGMSGTSGTVTRVPQTYAATGTASATSNTAGTADRVLRTLPASGTVTATSAASGAPSLVTGPATLPAAGVIAATSTTAGTVTATFAATGTTAAVVAVVGDVTVIVAPVTYQVAGTVAASSGTTGDATIRTATPTRDLRILATSVPTLTWSANAPATAWQTTTPVHPTLPTTTPASAWATSLPEH